MARCVNCGKQSLLGRVNKNGLCRKCETDQKRIQTQHELEASMFSAEKKAAPPIIQAYNPSRNEYDMYVISRSYHDVDVAGFGYYSTKNIYARQSLDFCPNPKNPYDYEAVEIWAGNKKIGHVHRNALKDMINETFYSGGDVRGIIENISRSSVRYGLYFYKSAYNWPCIRHIPIKINVDGIKQIQEGQLPRELTVHGTALSLLGIDIGILYDRVMTEID